MSLVVDTAVILAAGKGNRRLPITRAIEKAMIPIGNRPTIDYIVEQCCGAGIKRIIFIVNSHDSQIKKYYGASINSVAEYPHLAVENHMTCEYVVQGSDSYGTAAALLAAEPLLERCEQFAVLVADSFIHAPSANPVRTMVTALQSSACSGVVAGLLLPGDQAKKYGIIKATKRGKLVSLVEKPDNLKDDGVYVTYLTYTILSPPIFAAIASTPLSDTGELYLPWAINTYARTNHVQVQPTTGRYIDSGELKAWLAAQDIVTI